MHRRRALGLFAAAIDGSVSSQTHAFADPESCPEHVEWFAKVMENHVLTFVSRLRLILS